MRGYLSYVTRQARTTIHKTNHAGSTARLSCLARGIALVVVISLSFSISLNKDRMQSVAAFGYAGAFLVMLLSNATLVLPAPGLVFVFALGSSLHPVLVGLFAAVGATLGEVSGYVTGYSGLPVMEKTRLARRVERWMLSNGPLTIFLLSIVPNPLFDLAGVLAGASRMPLWRFLGTAFCGKLIQSTSIALAGAMSLTWVEDWLTH